MKTDMVKWVDKYGIIHEYPPGVFPNLDGNPLERHMVLLSVIQAQLEELGVDYEPPE